MQLNEAQKEAVRAWAAEGLNLSEIQKKIRSEFGLSMTYMDVRFLVIDVGAAVQDKPGSGLAGGAADEQPADQEAGEEAPAGVLDAEDGLRGSVSVEVDVVTKPGAVVSGRVTFSDGVSAAWFLDQVGRLAIDAGRPGYKPDEQDLRDFQSELRAALEKRGF